VAAGCGRVVVAAAGWHAVAATGGGRRARMVIKQRVRSRPVAQIRSGADQHLCAQIQSGADPPAARPSAGGGGCDIRPVPSTASGAAAWWRWARGFCGGPAAPGSGAPVARGPRQRHRQLVRRWIDSMQPGSRFTPSGSGADLSGGSGSTPSGSGSSFGDDGSTSSIFFFFLFLEMSPSVG
jgi:hypothetical protein